MLELLLLVLVLWIALGLDRPRRYRPAEQEAGSPGRHRLRAVPDHRRRRLNGASLALVRRPAGCMYERVIVER